MTGPQFAVRLAGAVGRDAARIVPTVAGWVLSSAACLVKGHDPRLIVEQGRPPFRLCVRCGHAV